MYSMSICSIKAILIVILDFRGSSATSNIQPAPITDEELSKCTVFNDVVQLESPNKSYLCFFWRLLKCHQFMKYHAVIMCSPPLQTHISHLWHLLLPSGELLSWHLKKMNWKIQTHFWEIIGHFDMSQQKGGSGASTSKWNSTSNYTGAFLETPSQTTFGEKGSWFLRQSWTLLVKHFLQVIMDRAKAALGISSLYFASHLLSLLPQTASIDLEPPGTCSDPWFSQHVS